MHWFRDSSSPAIRKAVHQQWAEELNLATSFDRVEARPGPCEATFASSTSVEEASASSISAVEASVTASAEETFASSTSVEAASASFTFAEETSVTASGACARSRASVTVFLLL